MVTQLINDRGNAVANQFVITENGAIKFQSYRSLVCKIENNTVTFGRDWEYSRTTMKHLNTFLRDNYLGSIASAGDIRKAIKNGCTPNGTKVVYDETMF